MAEFKKTGLFDGAGSEPDGEWVTVNGSHIFIEDGESLEEALTKCAQGGIINARMKDNQGIDIRIDEFTDCLKERISGKVFDTQISKIEITRADFKEWKFDWSKEAKNDVQVFALRIKGTDEIQGLVSTRVEKENSAVFVSLVETSPGNYGSSGKYEGVGGHLFAEAVKQSIDIGYEGFVYFVSKTNLIKYYEEKLGAKYIGDNKMYIDTVSAYKLYNRYYGGNKK